MTSGGNRFAEHEQESDDFALSGKENLNRVFQEQKSNLTKNKFSESL